MTRNADFKRLVRARMAKTGEAYTTARTQILSKPRTKTQRPAAEPPRDYATLAGFSDRTIEATVPSSPSGSRRRATGALSPLPT